MATNYGQDSYCLSDIGLVDVQVTSPKILIGQRLYRRLTTPRGGLAAFGGDGSFGWDVRQLINAKLAPSSVLQYQQQIQAECEKDEEVKTAPTVISQSGNSITVTISVTSAAGPFTLVMPVQNLTAAQIFTS